MMKKYTTTISIVVTLLFVFTLIVWAKMSQPQSPATVNDSSDIITTKGMHTHPELTIFVKGEKIEIPQNIGMVGEHKPMHTHDDIPIIHLEYPAKVTKDDTRLGKFFEVWGKDFYAFGKTVTMTVNGTSNTMLENYLMQDGDKIELRYE